MRRRNKLFDKEDVLFKHVCKSQREFMTSNQESMPLGSCSKTPKGEIHIQNYSYDG